LKTIKQIADEIGVTKQAVQKRISREPLYTSIQPCLQTKGGTKYIDEIGENLIKQAFKKILPTTVSIDNTDMSIDKNHGEDNTFCQILKAELDAKNKQLAEKDKQLAEQAKQIDRLTSVIENNMANLKITQLLHDCIAQEQPTSQPDDQEYTYGIYPSNRNDHR